MALRRTEMSGRDFLSALICRRLSESLTDKLSEVAEQELKHTHSRGQFACSGSLFGHVDTRCITELQQNLSSCSRGIIGRITLKGSADIYRLQVTDLPDFGAPPGSPQQATLGLVQFQQNQSRIPQKHEKYSFLIDFLFFYGCFVLFLSVSGQAKLDLWLF